MKIVAVFNVILFGFAIRSCDSQTTQSQCSGAALLSPIDSQSFVAGLNSFAVDLYRTAAFLQQNGRTDFVFSPASIAIALGMVLQGAKGKTRAEIKTGLAPNVNDTMLSPVFDRLLSALNSPTNQYQLNTANKLYIKNDFTLSPSYESSVAKCFHTTTEPMNVSNPVATAGRVNSWVEQQTNSKIKNLISPAAITAGLRLLIVNAIYFKGDWQTPFTTQYGGSTAKNTFTGIDGGTKQIDFMSMTNNFLYTQDSSTTVLGIPYKNNELQMFLFLPTDPAGFSAFEASLTFLQLNKLMVAASNTRVNVLIPKFTTKGEYPLKSVLKAVGMKSMFNPQLADLTGISSSTGEKLFIGQAKHMAFIEVNEKGTEAAAATAFGVMTMSARMEQPPTFFAQRPFLFAVRHVSSGAVLFMGSIVDSK